MDAAKALTGMLSGSDPQREIGKLLDAFGGESAIAGVLGALGAPKGNGPRGESGSARFPGAEKTSGAADAPDLGSLLRMGKLLGEMRGDDKNIALLNALRPLLSPARQKKTDTAIRLLRIARLWPAVSESGILEGILGGGEK